MGKAKGGEKVTVDMNGAAVVPGNILDDIKGKDVAIVFDMGNGITWSVDGKSITGDKTGDIDFSVTVGTDFIPEDAINDVVGIRDSKQISLAYDGEFGFTAVLSIDMEADNAGMYANLFYYNVAAGKLEFICTDKIAADGTARLTFTHASDYVIAIDTEPMDGGPENPGESETSSVSDTSGDSAIISPGTGNNAWKPWGIIVVSAFVLLVGLGVLFEENRTRLQKSKKRK